MFKLARPFFILVETPLHAGSGSDLGIVDLPIQREKHTGFPKVEASGLKGCMKEAFRELPQMKLNGKVLGENERKQAINLTFGPDEGDLHAGALGFTDARLLLFPVRSARGVFAWITCPRVLHRMVQDWQLAGLKEKMPSVPQAGSVPEKSQLLVDEQHILLEEYAFKVQKNGDCSKLAEWLAGKVLPRAQAYNYWREKMKQNLVVLADDDFSDFVHLATEVITRTRIDQTTGTVQDGALFTEEYLPVESVLYALALATPIFVEKNKDKAVFVQNGGQEEKLVMDFWATNLPSVIQLGGNATIGKGLVSINIPEVGK